MTTLLVSAILSSFCRILKPQTIIKTQETERQRIARELHDNIISQLNLLRLQSLTVKDHKALNNKISAIMNTVRTLSHQLIPPYLESVTLNELITDYLTDINENFVIDHHYYNLADISISPEEKLHIFRIFQELISNVIHHARTQKLVVQLKISPKHLLLIVSDNGIGFDLTKSKHGLGNKNIAIRAKHLNASFKYQSVINRGTRFILIKPF